MDIALHKLNSLDYKYIKANTHRCFERWLMILASEIILDLILGEPTYLLLTSTILFTCTQFVFNHFGLRAIISIRFNARYGSRFKNYLAEHSLTWQQMPKLRNT